MKMQQFNKFDQAIQQHRHYFDTIGLQLVKEKGKQKGSKDLIKIITNDYYNKLLKSDLNSIHFYDIQQPLKSSSSDTSKATQNFQSIHTLPDKSIIKQRYMQLSSNISTIQTHFPAIKLPSLNSSLTSSSIILTTPAQNQTLIQPTLKSEIESEAKTRIKKQTGMQLQLPDIYHLMDQDARELQRIEDDFKVQISSLQPQSNTERSQILEISQKFSNETKLDIQLNEDGEPSTILKGLENWKKYIKSKTVDNKSDYKYKLQLFQRKLPAKLPSLNNTLSRQNLSLKEITSSKLVLENQLKIATTYSELKSIINQISNPLFNVYLNGNIPTFLKEMARFYERNVIRIEERINKEMKDLEVVIYQKNLQIKKVRTQNSDLQTDLAVEMTLLAKLENKLELTKIFYDKELDAIKLYYETLRHADDQKKIKQLNEEIKEKKMQISFGKSRDPEPTEQEKAKAQKALQQSKTKSSIALSQPLLYAFQKKEKNKQRSKIQQVSQEISRMQQELQEHLAKRNLPITPEEEAKHVDELNQKYPKLQRRIKQINIFYIITQQSGLKQKIERKQVLIQQVNNQYKNNCKALEFCDASIKALSKSLKKWKKLSIKLYLLLILNGLDCRNQGISRLLKELKNYGVTIEFSQITNQLDKGAKNYLIKKSQLEQKLEDLQSIEKFLLQQSRITVKDSFFQINEEEMLKEEEESTDEKDKKENESNTEVSKITLEQKIQQVLYKDLEKNKKETLDEQMYQQIQSNIQLMCKTNTVKCNESINQSHDNSMEIKQLYNMLNISSHSQRPFIECEIGLYEGENYLNNQSESFFVLHEKRQEEAKFLLNKLEEIKKAEITRLMKEFTFRNYLAKHQTTHYKVFSILWGVKVATTELIRNQLLGNPVSNQQENQE